MKELFEWLKIIIGFIIVWGIILSIDYCVYLGIVNYNRLIKEYPQCAYSRDIPTCAAIYERGK